LIGFYLTYGLYLTGQSYMENLSLKLKLCMIYNTSHDQVC